MNANSLVDKKILFITPAFFNYYINIINGLENKGAKVYLINENFAQTSYLYKFFFRKNEIKKFKYADKKILNELKKIDEIMDIVFVLKGEAISTNVMDFLKEKYPIATYIMYQWDSVNNNPNAVNIARYFDKIFTFDPYDAKKNGWEYRPLFYMEKSCNPHTKKDIQLAMIGTLYYKRVMVLEKSITICEKFNYSMIKYLYVNKAEYYLHKYILHDDRYRAGIKDGIQFKPLPQDKIDKIYDRTVALIDYTVEGQSGLTMRTVEAAGHHCKIITNNKNILDTGLYNENNVYIYDLDNFEIPLEFMEKPYKELDKDVYRYYSLEGWIESVFMKGKKNDFKI